MYAPAENITDFTGVLVQRQYKAGQRYIQLVFETAEGLRLSVSRNLKMVRSLSVGRTYHVKGPEFSLGEKVYIHEPTAIPIEAKPSFFRRHVKLFIIATIVLVAAGTTSAIFFSTHGSANANLQAPKKSAAKTNPIIQAPATSTATTPTQPAVTTTTPTTATKTSKTTSHSSSTSSGSSNSSQAPATQPSGGQTNAGNGGLGSGGGSGGSGGSGAGSGTLGSGSGTGGSGTTGSGTGGSSTGSSTGSQTP